MEPKLTFTVVVILLAILLTNRHAYKLVNEVTSRLGFDICDDNGCPNWYGVILQAVLLGVGMRLVMELPSV